MAIPQQLTAQDLACQCQDNELKPRPPEEGQAPTLPGQKRGMEALKFGLAVKERRFNITVTGAPLSGKTPTVQRVVAEKATGEPPALDICLRQNFDNPLNPKVLYLPAGGGAKINRFVEELLTLLDKQIPKLLEQASVKAHMQSINDEAEAKEQALSREVESFAESLGVVVQTQGNGVNLIPMVEGRPMKEDEYLSLSVEQRDEIETKRKDILARMSEVNPKILVVEKEKRETLDGYVEKLISELVHLYMAEMRHLLEETPELTGYLDELEEEIIDKRFLFLSESGMAPFGGHQLQSLRSQFVKNSRLNVLVDRTGQTHAPVVMELQPNYTNLIGGVDYVEERGVLKTDFLQIRAGSLLQASGGYLVMQAIDLINQPLAYAGLKRALRAGKIKLQDQMAEYGLRSTSHMEPDIIDFATKVIVVGDENLVSLIRAYDGEFDMLFKVSADFSSTLERTRDVMDQYVDYVSHHAKKAGLLPLTPGAMARLIEESSRQVGHQGRLSAQMTEMMDVLIEADTLARLETQPQLTREVVSKALANRNFRHNKIEELVKRQISEGTILLDFKGEKVGQVNGLAVYNVGQVMFGVPTRITAQAYAGRAGIINIEREADLSGNIHTKGVLILNGYLGRLFGRRVPLALSVSICFEQNYGMIDGDSATVAEFLATLSAITGLPLRQNIAVTGSMNQHGQVQPIGGVNEKICGFFQFAKNEGFPEGCGVMIPHTNQVNLMLPDEVVAAVGEGKFHIYAMRRAEEALELMMGVPAGDPAAPEDYPPGTVYGQALDTLRAFGKVSEQAKGDKEDKEKKEGGE